MFVHTFVLNFTICKDIGLLFDYTLADVIEEVIGCGNALSSLNTRIPSVANRTQHQEEATNVSHSFHHCPDA